MYQNHGQFAAAGASYRAINLTSRIESASPHGLIAILYEELLQSLSIARTMIRQNVRDNRVDGAPRAQAILSSLEASLDHEAGPDIAPALAAVYREARRLVSVGIRDRDSDAIDQARKLIAEIAGAWSKIG